MIARKDVLSFSVTPDELQYCKEHPAPGCAQTSTGQLRTLGNLAIGKMLGLSQREFEQQLDAAQEMGTSYAFEGRSGCVEGLTPTVSVIRDEEVLRKHLVVPACQLHKDPRLRTHYAIGVFVVGETDSAKEIVSVESVKVAGWVTTSELSANWMGKEDGAPFKVKNSAVAPCVILSPIHTLLKEIKWNQYCV